MAIGHPLRVRSSKSEAEIYRSRMIETMDEFAFIEVPLHYKTNQPLHGVIGSSIWVEFHAVDGATCGYQTKVYGVNERPMKVWKIDSPSVAKIERDQRREFVRVQTDLEVNIEVPQVGENIETKVFTRDISGGGMALLIPKTLILHPGSIIETQFCLPDTRFVVQTKCAVIRVSDRNEQGYASASVQFIDLKEVVRQRIIQYTFKRQRLLNSLT